MLWRIEMRYSQHGFHHLMYRSLPTTMDKQPIAPVQKPAEIPYVNDMSVREIFVDTARMVSFNGAMVHIELAVTRPEVTGENQSKSSHVPVARLVLTPFAAQALQEYLKNILTSMENSGALRRVSAPAPLKQ
jgi:hypothetical protein